MEGAKTCLICRMDEKLIVFNQSQALVFVADHWEKLRGSLLHNKPKSAH